MTGVRVVVDDFDGEALDERWTPHYLPHWSSRDRSRADWTVEDSVLTLRIGPEHPIWCEGDHEPPIRVSGIQSANWSGPVGSTLGQQPFRPGQTVREAQPEHDGLTIAAGRVAIRARMSLSPRSMASLWMIGPERVPEDSAEICVVEIFGRSIEADAEGRPSAEIGQGLHAFRDPRVDEDFAAPRRSIDVADWHEYAVEWDSESAIFFVDGAPTRTCARPPTYPMQLELAVFDFPEWGEPGDAHVPRIEVDWVRSTPAPIAS